MNITTKRALTGVVFVLVFAVFSTTAFAGILKWPYMIYPGVNTQMQVLWQDNAAETTNTLSWGTDTTYSMGSVTVPEYNIGTVSHQHKYTITGLTPDTKYYFKVEDAPGGNVYSTGSFTTAPNDNVDHIRFIGQGDSRSQAFAFDNLLRAVSAFTSIPGNEEYKRLAIHNGDWVSTDGESYWTSQWFVLDGSGNPRVPDIVSYQANTPIDGVKGNHDNSSGYSGAWPKYFSFPFPNQTLKTHTNNPTCTPYDTGTDACLDGSGNPYYNNLYWSMDYGPVHFTFVDQYSSYAPGSAQYTWLVNDLASTTKPWKVLVHHAPAYSAGSDADDTTARTYLEPLVTQYGVDVIFCGHSHNYARTGVYNSVQANGDTIAMNVPHITSGGGGAPIYQPDMTNNGSYPHVITAWPAFEFMAFDIKGKTLTMTAYQVNNVSATDGVIVPLSSTFPSPDGGSTLSLSPIETTVVNHFTNVSPQISATTGNFVYNRATQTYNGTVTITNNGADLTGNIHVVLDGMLDLNKIGNPSNQYSTTTPKLASMIAKDAATSKTSKAGALLTTVTLKNATGSHNGQPMIKATASGLANGASVTIPVQFSNPTNAKITFNPVTYQE